RGVRYVLNDVVKRRGGVNEIDADKLRDSFGRDLLNEGGDLRSVECLVGEVNLWSTGGYRDVWNEQVRKVYLNGDGGGKKGE
ncbi:site-specific integrase, partial [Staphylococcus epidermidis]